MVVAAATKASLRLTPPELATSPDAFRRADGSSRFRPQHSTVFSSADLLAAEDRLLVRANTLTAPALEPSLIKAATSHDTLGHRPPEGQAHTIQQITETHTQIPPPAAP